MFLDTIRTAKVEKGKIALWWLGQMGYVMKTQHATLLVDGFLMPRPDRLVPPAFDPADADCFDAVLGTHDHDDHIDCYAWERIAKANPRTLFFGSALHKKSVCGRTGIPLDRYIGMNEGSLAHVGDISVQAIAAAHEFLDFDAETQCYPHLSYIIASKIFHAGDTLTYDGQRAKLKAFAPLSAMILPINGRDAERYNRNCIGNMTFQEAVDLAGDMQTKLAIPGHYDMFAGNLGNPEDFREYLAAKYPHVPCHIPERLVRFDIDL